MLLIKHKGIFHNFKLQPYKELIIRVILPQPSLCPMSRHAHRARDPGQQS